MLVRIFWRFLRTFGPKVPMTVLFVASLVCGSAICHAATYAVVAGVDDYAGASKLGSCLNDAKAINDFLVRDQAVPTNNVTLLWDGKATAGGIEQALKQQCKRAGKQDEVFFYFSGHGTIVPDWDGKGKVVKALVPYGALPGPVKMSNLLVQDRLKRALADTKASRVIVMLDCCHAGTWTRSVLSARDGQKVKSVDIGWDAAEPELIKAARDPFVEFRKADAVINYTWLGACQSNQVSYCGQNLSQFTERFLASMREAPGRKLNDLFPGVAKRVEDATKDNQFGPQTPQAEGTLDSPLLASRAGVTAAPSPTLDVPSAPPVPPPTERQDFPIAVSLNKQRFIKDDKLIVIVTPARDCYLRLYLMNAALEIQQIFPNEFQKENHLQGGQKVRVPSEQAGFQFTMEGPWGVETIVAVASTEQFTDLVAPVYRDGLFTLGQETPGGILARGIRVERRQESSATPLVRKPQISITKVHYVVSEKASP